MPKHTRHRSCNNRRGALRTFIRTSNETAEVDEDLSSLRTAISQEALSTLRETSFDFTEEGRGAEVRTGEFMGDRHAPARPNR